MEYRPLHFIAEPVEVSFETLPLLEKKPTCPTSFTWRGQVFRVIDLIAEWRDYERRGRFARNMQPQHAAVASQHGSWGVGQFYFRVKTDHGQVFDLEYDRAPKDADHRKGEWILYRELIAIGE